MEDKIKAIREACIAAQPDRNFEYITECGCPSREDITIIDLIKIADVLLAFQHFKKESGSSLSIDSYCCLKYRAYRKIKYSNWNLLKDDLTQQPEETINFLHTLISNKE